MLTSYNTLLYLSVFFCTSGSMLYFAFCLSSGDEGHLNQSSRDAELCPRESNLIILNGLILFFANWFPEALMLVQLAISLGHL